MMYERSCPYNQEKLVAYTSGNTSKNERLEVERHLAVCPDCRNELMELQKTWLFLDLWQDKTENAKPRLHDLHHRINQAKEAESIWTKFKNTLSVGRGAFHLAPTAALASILAVLLLLPLIQSQFSTVPVTSNGNNGLATDVSNEPASKLINVATGEINDAHNDPIVAKREDLEEKFAYALKSGEQDQRNLESLLYGILPNMRTDSGLFSVGFQPNPGLVPAHNPTNKLQPAALPQLKVEQDVKVKNE